MMNEKQTTTNNNKYKLYKSELNNYLLIINNIIYFMYECGYMIMRRFSRVRDSFQWMFFLCVCCLVYLLLTCLIRENYKIFLWKHCTRNYRIGCGVKSFLTNLLLMIVLCLQLSLFTIDTGIYSGKSFNKAPVLYTSF